MTPCDCDGICRYRTGATNECARMLAREHGEMSVRQIAEHEGISFQRVQQIEKEALAKLRRILEGITAEETRRSDRRAREANGTHRKARAA